MKKKICSRCGESKNLNAFNKCSSRKDGRQTFCKECNRKSGQNYYGKNKEQFAARNKKARQELRDWFSDLKSSMQCTKCAEDHPGCLEFHHPDDDKDDHVSRMVSNMCSKERIFTEIEKCICLCANCHRKLHWNTRESANG